jgi:hypothetical protein
MYPFWHDRNTPPSFNSQLLIPCVSNRKTVDTFLSDMGSTATEDIRQAFKRAKNKLLFDGELTMVSESA